MILFRIVSPPDLGIDDFEADPSVGVFLGFLAALGVAAGGWMAMREEGTSYRATGTGAGTAPPPPPPPPPPAGGPPAGGGPTV